MNQVPASIELEPPDLSAWREGNTGVPYFARLESRLPGPRSLLLALVHGNELCGAIALDRLLAGGFRPACGTVTIGFANMAAFLRFDPRAPNASRFVDEDLNRVWEPAVLDGRRRSAELDRARQIQPLVDEVDHLLDLHSMQHATEPLTLAGTTAKGTALARRMGMPRLIVRDRGHAGGRRLRDYGGFDDPDAAPAAVLVECGQHWLAGSAMVAQQAALAFLDGLGQLDPAYRAAHPPPRPAAPQRVVEVTHTVTMESSRFVFTRPFRSLEVVAAAGTLIGFDGPREIRTPYPDCVMVMPALRLVRGQTAVRLGRFAG